MKVKFARKDSHKIKRIKKNWRRPRGLHNKLRLRKGGHGKVPSIGYKKSSKPATIILKNMNDLAKLTKDDVVTISRTIGYAKKVKFLEKIKEIGSSLSSIKDIDAYLTKLKENKIKKTKEKKDKAKAKQEKKKKSKQQEQSKKAAKAEEVKKEEKVKKEVQEKVTENKEVKAEESKKEVKDIKQQKENIKENQKAVEEPKHLDKTEQQNKQTSGDK